MTILSENENAVLSSTSVLTSENILESAGAAFKFTVDTTETGVTASDTFRLPMDSPSVNVDILVSSPDLIGSPVNITDISIVNDLQFNTGGIHEITCVNNGTNILQWRFRGGANNGGDKNKFISIEEWGIFQLTYGSAFQGCVNLTTIPTSGTPIMPTISSAGGGSMFNGCSSLIVNTDTDVSGWDVSFINNFDQFAHDVGSWNPSGMDSWVPSICTNFSEMFEDSGFVGALPSWNTSSGATFKSMFKNCGIDFDMSGWDFTNLVGVNGGQNFMYGVTTFSTENYDKLLVSLGSQNVNTGVTIHFGSSSYTSPSPASEGRTALLSKGWIIIDTSDYNSGYVGRYEFPSSDITTALVGSDLTNSGASYDDDSQRGDSALFGTSDFMSNLANNGTSDTSFSGWIYPTAIGKVITGVSGDSNNFMQLFDSTTIRAYINSNALLFTIPEVTLSNWYHLVVTYAVNGSDVDVKVYLNGIESSSGTLTALSSSIPAQNLLGKYNAGANWLGNMAFVGIYDSVLTQANVTALYNDETWVPRDAINEYNFATSLTLTDDSIGGDNLTNSGATWISEDDGSADFDGSSEMTGLGQPTSSGDYTISFGFKLDTVSAVKIFDDSSNTDTFIDVLSATQIRARVASAGGGGGQSKIFNVATMSADTLYIATMIITNNTAQLVLDDIIEGALGFTVGRVLELDGIGANAFDGSSPYVQIFNRPLRENEAIANYHARKAS